MTLYPTSIRAKLTLTAVTVMGVLFTVLGVIVEVGGREEIMASVDADLAKHASEIIRAQRRAEQDRPPRPPQEWDPNRPPRNDGPGGDEQNPPGEPPRDGGPAGRRGPGPNFGGLRKALADIGDPLLAIGPRFIAITPGPPFAPPDMMGVYDKSVLDAAEKYGVVYSTVVLGNQKVRIITKRAIDDNGRRWLAQVPYPLGDVDRSIATLSRTLLVLLPFGLLLTAGACTYLIRRVMRPISDISSTADSISGEDLSRRLTVQGSDEFAQLAGTMNGMLGRVETAFTAQKTALQRVEAILKQQRRFTADASHELKTPLAVIKANTGIMLHGAELSEDSRASVKAIDAAASRMNRLVQGLMLLARTEAAEMNEAAEHFDLQIALQNAIDQVHRSPVKAVTFHGQDEEITIPGVERDVERAFVNLIDNACRHTSVGGHVDVSAARTVGEIVVTVADDGEGIAPEHLPHLFERFYRADAARSSDTGGTGLGLAICKGIIESAGGTISIESTLRKGTTVTVRFPSPKVLATPTEP